MNTSSKPTVAFFDFACCEGCQLTVLKLDENLLTLLEHVRIVEWREAMTGKADHYDIAFCEGSVCSEADIQRAKDIRSRSGILVSLGSCASIGCHNALRNRFSGQDPVELVYGPDANLDTISVRPITAVVQTDYQVLGCPVSLPEFVMVFKSVLMGKSHTPPNQPVCVECKLKDNVCVLEKGMFCLGPVTRCGCNAICTSYGDPCQGCRGFIDQANSEAALAWLEREDLHSIMKKVRDGNRFNREEIQAKMAVYNNLSQLNPEEDQA